MEEIYFAALDPDTAATNSALVDLVDTVACSLLLLNTDTPKGLLRNEPTYLLEFNHTSCEASI